jgi:hypothetical protein
VVKAFPTRSGEARVLCGRCFPKWTRDGRFLFLAFTPNQGMGDNRTYVIKLSPGRALPELPKEGLNTAADLQKLPLAAVIDRLSVFPGRSEGEYAYMKQNAHQNLHRILLF